MKLQAAQDKFRQSKSQGFVNSVQRLWPVPRSANAVHTRLQGHTRTGSARKYFLMQS